MSKRWAEAGLVFCALVWGSTFFLVKDALSGVDAYAMIAERFLIAALLLAPWALSRASRFKPLKEGALLGFLLFLIHATQTVGLKFTSASNSAFITGLFVVFVPLYLLVFLGKPPTRAQWFSCALALAGVGLLTGGARGANRGDALTLLCAMLCAAHLLTTDRVVRAEADPVVLAFHQFWVTGALAAFSTLALGRSFAIRGSAAFWSVAYLAVLPTALAFLIQIKGQKTVAPIQASLIFSLEPVFGAMFAWTLGGEPFHALRAAGGMLVVAAMLTSELSKLTLFRGRRKEVLPV